MQLDIDLLRELAKNGLVDLLTNLVNRIAIYYVHILLLKSLNTKAVFDFRL